MSRGGRRTKAAESTGGGCQNGHCWAGPRALPYRAGPPGAGEGAIPSREAVEITELTRNSVSEDTDEGVSEAASAETDATEVVEEAGHFRVYLGAAAGVGKTYAMLNEGQRRRGRRPAGGER